MFQNIFFNAAVKEIAGYTHISFDIFKPVSFCAFSKCQVHHFIKFGGKSNEWEMDIQMYDADKKRERDH